MELSLFSGKECLGTMKADQLREDIQALNLHPTGQCGFELVIKRKLETGEKDVFLKDHVTGRILLKIDCGNFTVAQKKNPLGLAKSFLQLFRGEPAPILFMHIPKTAGTSFNTLVRSLLPNVPAVSHIEAYEKEKYPQLTKHNKYISGHLRYGVFNEHFCSDRSRLYTIVREPFSHLHSHLQWIIRSAVDEKSNTLMHRNPTIYNLGMRIREIDFSKNDAIAAFVNDLTPLEAAFFDNMQTRHFLNNPVERVCEDDLQEAVANSSSFDHIGLTEEYDDFVKVFSQQNNINVPVKLERLNKSRSKKLFDIGDPVVRDILKPLVCYDVQLYDHIQSS